MKDIEIKNNFNLGHTTLHEWKNSQKGEGRKLLYETLKAIPIEFVESVKEQMDEQENKDKKLREALGLE